MELEKILNVIERLPTESGIVEVTHRNKQGDSETTPGYLGRIQTLLKAMQYFKDINEVPEQFRDGLKEGYENPYIELHPSLDRNQCRTGVPLKIKIEDINYIVPLAISELKEEK